LSIVLRHNATQDASHPVAQDQFSAALPAAEAMKLRAKRTITSVT
jgi:hypothetical protein